MPLGISRPSGGGNAGSLRAVELTDFRGGLNFSAKDFKLERTESADMLNVDVHAAGGLEVRGGMLAVSDDVGFQADTVFRGAWRIDLPGAEYVAIARGGDANTVPSVVSLKSTGVLDTSIANMAIANSAEPEGVFGVQMNGATYLTSRKRELNKITYNSGTGLLTYFQMTEAGTANWDDDDLVATFGVLPAARCAAVFDNKFWVASTVEDGTAYNCRIRWSEDGNPESWGTDDWIDIDVGEDGDQITALGVFGEVLVVFKKRAMYAVLPDDTTQYRVVTLSRAVGATNEYAVCTSAFGLWFWDGRTGLHMWSGVGGGPQYAGAKLKTAIEDGRIPTDAPVQLSWANNRLWVSADVGGTESSLVYDPTVGPGGAWTLYQPGVEALARLGSNFVGFAPLHRRWVAVDQRTSVDDFGSGAVTIDAHWVSPWIHGSAHYQNKRFRRPKFTVSANGEADVRVDVYRNLSSANLLKTFFLALSDLASGGRYGEAVYGTDVYSSGEDSDESELIQGPDLCTAKSVQLKVTGPTQSVRWRVDSMAITYVPLPARN